MTNSADHTSNGDPLLRQIAEHERGLLARIEGARKEAQVAIERARADARALREEDAGKLNEEFAAFRRDGEATRKRAYDGTVTAAQDETEHDRKHVNQHAAEVAQEVLAMIVPGDSL